MKVTSPDWAVAIFAARESAATLGRSIEAAVAACAGRHATIDVIVNGNRALAAAVARRQWDGDAQVRVWNVDIGDKAHAWNEYLHRIWPGARPAFFIDGYTALTREVLAALYWRVASDRPAAALRLREPLLKTGGPYANVHAISAASMAALRHHGFRLPLGLYRTDSLIGAVLGFGLDMAAQPPSRVRAVEPEAPRMVRSRARPRDVQGEPVAASARRAARPEAAPQATRQLIHDWLVEHPRQARPLFFKRPLSLAAARKLKAQNDWAALWTAPELVSPAAHR